MIHCYLDSNHLFQSIEGHLSIDEASFILKKTFPQSYVICEVKSMNYVQVFHFDLESRFWNQKEHNIKIPYPRMGWIEVLSISLLPDVGANSINFQANIFDRDTLPIVHKFACQSGHY